MTITKHFDNPDDALAFVEEEITELNASDLPADHVTYVGTHYHGKFTRVVYADEVPIEQVVYKPATGLDVVGRGSYTEIVFEDIKQEPLTHDDRVARICHWATEANKIADRIIASIDKSTEQMNQVFGGVK